MKKTVASSVYESIACLFRVTFVEPNSAAKLFGISCKAAFQNQPDSDVEDE
jgi:hypothetical protein